MALNPKSYLQSNERSSENVGIICMISLETHEFSSIYLFCPFYRSRARLVLVVVLKIKTNTLCFYQSAECHPFQAYWPGVSIGNFWSLPRSWTYQSFVVELNQLSHYYGIKVTFTKETEDGNIVLRHVANSNLLMFEKFKVRLKASFVTFFGSLILGVGLFCP